MSLFGRDFGGELVVDGEVYMAKLREKGKVESRSRK